MGLLCPGEFIRTGISEGAGGIARGGLHRAGTAVQGREGQSSAAPALEASGQGAHARDAAPLEKQRHPGAAGFVGSRAVQDDVAVAGDFVMAALQFVRTQTQGGTGGINRGVAAAYNGDRMTDFNFFPFDYLFQEIYRVQDAFGIFTGDIHFLADPGSVGQEYSTVTLAV